MLPTTTLDQVRQFIATHAEFTQIENDQTLDLILTKMQRVSGVQGLTESDWVWLGTTGSALLDDLHCPLNMRVILGQMLGLLRVDTRPGVGLNADGLPDIVWCEIPAGEFITGSDKKRDPYAYRTEIPQKTAALTDNFQIAQYPITWAQYEAFINTSAYHEAQWWEGCPDDFRALTPEKPPVAYTNHPAVFVSWYQASAFCRWLTAQYRASQQIAPHERIRLPTDLEWEKAARGTDARVYPYGDHYEPDEVRANTRETDISQTSTVGIFPHGASPYGVHEMSGNVYEWCVASANATSLLRGGSFFLGVEWSRCAHRYEREPHLKLQDFGFRVVKC